MENNEKNLNTIIASNITRLLNARNKTQLDLAEHLGVTQATVSNWCNGIKMPRMDKIDRICLFFDVPRSALMSSAFLYTSSSTTSADIPDNARRSIPVFGRIPAGIPFEAIEDIRGYEDLSEELRLTNKEYFALEIEGNSMYPKYLSGDIVIFEQACDCESGDDCAVRINGDDATFKKVIKKADCIILQPLNPDFEPIVIDYSGENKPFFILGVAKEIRRKV